MSIVIADGDTTHAQALEAILQEARFARVATVGSAEELRKRLRQSDSEGRTTVDLVLFSDNLPDASVYECSELLTLSLHADALTFVFILESTPEEQMDAVHRAHEAGALDVVFGPVRSVDLVPRVMLALTIQRERRIRRAREESLESELAEHKVIEARLKHLVAHDDLTGLANRRHLEQGLALAIIRSHNFQRVNALLYVDLDQFKLVNDNEGHEIGDRVLIEVAQALRGYLPVGGMLARIAGDEFAVLLENTSEDKSLEKAEELREALGELRMQACAGSYQPTACVGLAMILPDEDMTATEIVARAHQACYVAKSQGRDSVHLYDVADAELRALRADAHWAPLIRQALKDDSLFLVFQPIMQLPERRVTHYEALVRVRDEKGNVCLPKDFMPTAERMALIHQIDLWVIEHAVDFLAALPPEDTTTSVSVNLSSHAFQSKSLFPLIKQKLAATWMPASRLTFEITETAAIMNFTETREMVTRLRELGCGFCLDDFGSGFSSFSYIKAFPVDAIKIDGTFVINILSEQTDQQLVKAMVDIGHSLGKKVTAEYVENERILGLLTELGVDSVQGNYVGAAGAYPPMERRVRAS